MNGSETKGASKSQPSEATGGGEKAKPARLCYVDDSRTSAYVVKRMLKPYGYEVDHFSSAEPALIALIESDYDLLLTDLKVSPTGMDGDDLVRTLRSSGHSKTRSLPIIVITGSTDTEVLSQVYRAGANQIMTKPVIGEELDAHIRELVSKKSLAAHVDDEFADLAAQADAQSKIEEKTSATVVPFGHESKKTVHSSGSSAEIEAKSERNVPAEPKDFTDVSPLTTPDGRIIPRPSEGGKPAAQVKPVIKEPIPESSQTTENPGAVTPEIANTPVTYQQPVPTPQPSVTTTQATSSSTAPATPPKPTRSLDPEMVKKAKAIAAAKRAKLIEQQRAKLAAQAKVREQLRDQILAQQAVAEAKKRKHVQEVLEPETPLTLEPLEADSINLTNRNSTPAPQPFGGPGMQTQSSPQVTARTQTAPSQPPVNKGLAAKKGVDLFAEAAKSAPADLRATAARLNSVDVFGGQAGAATDILQQMDAYTAKSAPVSVPRSGIFSSISSILELWGPKKLILAVVVLGVVGFFYHRWSGYFSDAVSIETTPVEQGEIFQSITVPGKVVSKLRVDIKPAIAGRLTNVYVEEGSVVKKGELMARLDDREAVSYLKRTEVNQHNAQEDVSMAERSLKRIRKAFSKGAVARRMVEEAEVELRSARARLTVAEDEVKTAKLGLENPRIVAPFAGIVTGRFAEVGQWAVPSDTLFSLVDQTQREVEVRVDAADSGGIAVGQTVTLSSDAFPTLEWPESVTRLAAATSNVGNANTVSVYISLGNRAPALRFGQQVDAEIRTAWNPSALKVPYGAIINHSGKSYVAVVHDNIVKLVPVETGIEDFSHIEIRQGVSIGQEVVLANGVDINDGQKVIVSSSKR